MFIKCRVLCLGLLITVLGSCVSATGGIATSNIPLEGRAYRVLGPAETTLSWWAIDTGLVGLPLSDPPIDQAMQTLLEEKQGDALINLRYWTDRSVFLFILIRNRFHLKAEVVKFK